LVTAVCAGLSTLIQPQPARADGVKFVFYHTIEVPPAKLETFDVGVFLGQNRIDGIIRSVGVSFAAQFVGQSKHLFSLGKEQFDSVQLRPHNPLQLEADFSRYNLYREYSRETHSSVLLGVGPVGAPYAAGVGEGSIAVLFDEPVCMVGFQTFIEGIAGDTNEFDRRGSIKISFYDAEGELLDKQWSGPMGLVGTGYRQEPAAPPRIKGILVQNLDLAGVFIDNLRFMSDCVPNVS
jgi:hypothetical protein